VIDGGRRQFIRHLCDSSTRYAQIAYARTSMIAYVGDQIIVEDLSYGELARAAGFLGILLCSTDTDRPTAGASNEVRGKVEDGSGQSTGVRYCSTASDNDVTFCCIV